MVDVAIIREWLNKAEEDLRFAEANLLEGNEFYAQICFHSNKRRKNISKRTS